MDYAERLKKNLIASDEIAEQMRQCVGDFDAFSAHLKTYIRLRYVIDDTDFWTDNIRELSSFSMQHQQDVIGDDRSALKDTSLNCAGATSSDTKQILLLMKLRKSLGIELDPAFMGTTKSVSEIAERLYSQLIG